MRQRAQQQLLDCVSANQLLQALTTLKHINEQPSEDLELSFSQASHSFFNTAQQNKQMDFELYMAIKGNSRANKKPTPPLKKIDKTPRKSLTPKNNPMSPHPPDRSPKAKISHLKSRSHSPLQMTPKSPINTRKAERIRKDTNKQNEVKIMQKPKINEMSKKILMEKEKKGQAYVPIQERMNKVMKERQEKIVKIQKKNVTLKEIEDRECTFKPVINDWKKIQNRLNITNDLSTVRHRNHNHCSTESSCITANQSITGNLSIDQISKLRKQVPHEGQKRQEREDNTARKKPKNSKFNVLLDLIQ